MSTTHVGEPTTHEQPAARPDPTDRRRARRRRVRRTLAGLLVTALLALAAIVVALVAPPQRAPGTADVVVVLGPPQPWRVEWATELVESGRAGAVLVSVDDDDHVPLCEDPGDLVVRCATPVPFSTRGEARMIRDALAENGWSTATVITATPNLFRAQLLVDRCVEDGVQVVARREQIPLRRWVMRFAWQAGGWAKALTRHGC